MIEHSVTVQFQAVSNHGYPWRAVCSCGWRSWGYVRPDIAEGQGQWHLDSARETV